MPKISRIAFTLWSKCNGNCGYCFNKVRKQNAFQLQDNQCITFNEFKEILKQAIPFGLSEIELSGGEPFLFPDLIFAMIKYANSFGIKTGIFSNGTLLNEKIIDKLFALKLAYLRIGLGGYDFASHSLERKGTREMFENAVNAIKYSIKKGINTRIFFPVTKKTFSFIEKMIDFVAKEFQGIEHIVFDFYIPNGVPLTDNEFLLSPEQHFFAIDSLLKLQKKYSVLKIIPYYGCFEFLSSEWNNEPVLKSPCGKERLAFLSNGNVTPCLCTLDVLGNFREKNFNLKKIADSLPHPSHYDFSFYAPCSSCNKYQVCHDSWCPSLTINGQGTYSATPSTCPSVRKYFLLIKQGFNSKLAVKQSLGRHNLNENCFN